MFNQPRVTALLLAFAMLLGVSNAQAQKIGYIQQDAILANMPERENVLRQLQQAAQQQQAEFQQEQQALQQQIESYQRQASVLSDSVRQRRETELRQRQQALQQSAQQRDQQLQQREMELMQPLLEEFNAALNDVAENNNVDVVLRSDAMLYVKEGTSFAVNLTPEVASRLGIDINAQQPEPSMDAAELPEGQ